MKALAVLDLVPGWAWALLLAGALAFAGVSRVQLAGARVVTAEARTATAEAHADLGSYKATAAESARLADRAERAEEARRTETQRRALDEAQSQSLAAMADRDDARAAHQRLQQRAAELAAAARAAGARADAAERRAAAGDPGVLLADVLGRCSQRVTVLAEYADRARIAGALCEKSYDALTAAQ